MYKVKRFLGVHDSYLRHQNPSSTKGDHVLTGEIVNLAQMYGADSSRNTILAWLFIIGGIVYAVGSLIAIIIGWKRAMQAIDNDSRRKQ